MKNKLYDCSENPNFVFPDICYCGHNNNEHILNDNKCVHNISCYCGGFLP